MLSREDRAYCAGLFEGEGNIYFGHQKNVLINGTIGRPMRVIQLCIAMTDREPLELFEDIMGVGKIARPYRVGIRKPIYTYRAVTFEKVQFVVCNMWMWLSPRRKEQVTYALKSYTSHELSKPWKVK